MYKTFLAALIFACSFSAKANTKSDDIEVIVAHYEIVHGENLKQAAHLFISANLPAVCFVSGECV